MERPLEFFAMYNGKPWCWCKLCQRSSAKAYRRNNLEKCRKQERKRRNENRKHVREVQRAWRAKNPEKQNEYNKRDYQRRKAQFVEWNRSRSLKRLYGLTIEQYEEMYRSQNGCCAICGGINVAGRRLAVDHCHKTNRVRALLCNTCNTTIGTAKENPNILQQCIAYLSKHASLDGVAGIVAQKHGI